MVLIVVLAPQCLAGMVILWGAGRARLRRGETLRFVVMPDGESAGPLSEALRRSDGAAGHKGIKKPPGEGRLISKVGQVGVSLHRSGRGQSVSPHHPATR